MKTMNVIPDSAPLDYHSGATAGKRPTAERRIRSPGHRRAFSLTEVSVVLTILAILLAMAVPSFRRSLEQSKADIAAANLRGLWVAERVYWLETRAFTADMSKLESLGLVDPALTSTGNPYVYKITRARANTFSASANRSGSTQWSGALTIDQTGIVKGQIRERGGRVIEPVVY